MSSSGVSPNQFAEFIDRAVDEMANHGVRFEAGLSDTEIGRMALALDAQPPPELTILLARALPCSDKFPAWREDPVGAVSAARDWITQAFAFDIEHNGYWAEALGARPGNTDDAVRTALAAIASGPPLVPIYAHRFMPTEPGTWGNPVLSLMQPTDTIYYGCDFADYLHREFRVTRPPWASDDPPPVPFWGPLLGLD